MAVKRPTKVQECGAWLMGVARTLANGAPVEIGRVNAIAFEGVVIDQLKKEAQEWAQVLGQDNPEPKVETKDANGS